MYIYINPTLLDAHQAELDYLGLHGYYLVTGVKSKVTPDGFDTNIDALHQAIEFSQPENSLTMLNVLGEVPPPERNRYRENRRAAAARHQARVDARADDPTDAASRHQAEVELERERIMGPRISHWRDAADLTVLTSKGRSRTWRYLADLISGDD
jgi:hypothetical protein